MSCGCSPPSKTSLWTPIPGFVNEIQPGENIDCYAKRAAAPGPNDDARNDLVNRIQNTQITADGTLAVNETFTLSAGPRNATSWSMTPTIPGLFFNTSTGKLSGTVDTSQENATFKVTITANDGAGVIDSREYTFTPSRPQKGSSLSFIQPYKASSGTGKINSGFGPRIHPISGAQKLHKGQDWVAATAAAKGKGTIVAAADGEVVSAGNDPSGYGLNVRINHKDASGKVLAMTLYAHCSQVLVSPGQKVSQGQTIAKEGSTGASTGNHLHFEVRLGGTTPVDPTPYLNGTIVETPPIQAGQEQPPADKARTNTAPVLTSNEVAARTANDCPEIVGTPTPTTITETPTTGYESPTTSGCTPAVRMTREETIAQINKALNEDSSLTTEDKNILKFFARIESGNDTYAKNPTSSALGLYQMLDATANRYFQIIGSSATCENRVNPYLATKAQIAFYKNEMLKYYNEYQTNGKMAGKTVSNTPFSQSYSSLSKAEFTYGLVHHDGVGNAVKGQDKGGVAYFQRRARELGFA